MSRITGSPPGMLQDDSRGLSAWLANRHCRKCAGLMKPGKAIAQTFTGVPDFVGTSHVCTVSAGGPGRLVDCLKCEACGWSVTT